MYYFVVGHIMPYFKSLNCRFSSSRPIDHIVRFAYCAVAEEETKPEQATTEETTPPAADEASKTAEAASPAAEAASEDVELKIEEPGDKPEPEAAKTGKGSVLRQHKFVIFSNRATHMPQCITQ